MNSIRVIINMPSPKAPKQDSKNIDGICTFKINTESQNLNQKSLTGYGPNMATKFFNNSTLHYTVWFVQGFNEIFNHFRYLEAKIW